MKKRIETKQQIENKKQPEKTKTMAKKKTVTNKKNTDDKTVLFSLLIPRYSFSMFGKTIRFGKSTESILWFGAEVLEDDGKNLIFTVKYHYLPKMKLKTFLFLDKSVYKIQKKLLVMKEFPEGGSK